MGRWVRIDTTGKGVENMMQKQELDTISFSIEEIHYGYEPDEYDVVMKLIEKGYVPENFKQMELPPCPPPLPKRVEPFINICIAPMNWGDRLMILFAIGVLIYFITQL